MRVSVSSMAVFLLRSVRRVLRSGLKVVNSGLRRLGPKYERVSEPVVDQARVAQIAQFLLSLDQPDERAMGYVRVHAERLAITAALTPLSTSSGRCLELGSYMHLAPVLREFAGYRNVQAASFGPAGTKVFKSASIHGREVLACDLDLFDAGRDRFPYPDDYNAGDEGRRPRVAYAGVYAG